MNDYKRQIGARVKNARTMRGITQEMLAEKLDVSVSCISRIETGSSICSIKTLLAISEILEVGVEYLLYDFVTNHMITDPLSSEILLTIEPMPNNYKEHILQVVQSLYQTLPPK
ncbi:MAG: helix-turn-helix transcriptional regulator [Lachnospiraceae bacterium]|jgi:transcriptional regulator with XRE-family HTH domain|nr:helix-turn-helix transcriptional regulator [Lachnospiraceae bacterium]